MLQSLAPGRIRERHWLVHLALSLFTLCGFALALLGKRERALTLLSQVHRSSRWPALRRLAEPYIRRNLALFHRKPRQADAERLFERRRLLVLKPPLPGGEKGVLLVMFTEILDLLYSSMDLTRLLRDYTLVLEPSYPGYCHEALLGYTRFEEKIFVLSAIPGDFEFLRRLGSNLEPVDLGPCDWVDPRVAEPYLNSEKEFDIVMNAIWASLKRHYVLFRMLARAKRRYKVALIGAAWDGRKRADVEREAREYGVLDQVTIFESIPYSRAMEITSKSRVSVLLSLKEAGPRATAESIFCNVPVIVLKRLIGGIVKNVVPETGILAEEPELESAVEHLLEQPLAPRKWGIDHISCLKSTERLNDVLRKHAHSEGRPWSCDIAARANSPECQYVFSSDAERLAAYNDGLTDYLLGEN